MSCWRQPRPCPTTSPSSSPAPMPARALSSAPTRTASGSTVASAGPVGSPTRSEEHTSELQSLMRISYAVFCLKKKKKHPETTTHVDTHCTEQKQITHRTQ